MGVLPLGAEGLGLEPRRSACTALRRSVLCSLRCMLPLALWVRAAEGGGEEE